MDSFSFSSLFFIQKSLNTLGHDKGSLSYTPVCSSSPTISEGYVILKIIYSVTKYLIKHLVVYFLSSVSTLKNSSDVNIIRHIMTKIIT